MNFTLWIALLSFAQFLAQGQTQLSDTNTPPYMYMERNWQIPDNEKIGSRIVQVHGGDNEGGNLTYGLEAFSFFGSDKVPGPLPFRIDSNTGVVYLNDSLKGKAGENIRLYVTLSDGELVAKTEVYVQILNSSSPHKPPLNQPPFPGTPGGFNPSVFNGFPGFRGRLPPIPANMPPKIPSNMPNNISNLNNPPANIANNPPPVPTRPYFQEKIYPDRPKRPRNNSHEITPLRPVKATELNFEAPNNSLEESRRTERTTKSTNSNEDSETENNENDLGLVNHEVKSPEIAGTIASIIVVCAGVFTVGIIAVLFRRKIVFGKTKDSKDEMKKDSSGGITLREETSINLQEWRGPRAFSNRYEPWQREGDHSQLSTENSTPSNNLDRWEFPRHRLKFFNILGEGAFGQVWKCEALDLEGKDAGPTIVAVKTLKENANEKEKSDLVTELQVMKMLEPHPNVVKLLGCCTEKEPIFLIMEYISHGKLQSYLRNSRAERYYNNMHGKSKTLTSRDLTSFCYQVAKGMEFLSANGIRAYQLKGPGLENIPPLFLRNCSYSLSRPLWLLFNNSLSNGIFSSIWITAYVIPIFKDNGSKSSVENYRPIKISVIPKLMEALITEYLEKCFNKLIIINQRGFMKQKSISSNLVVFTEYLFNSLEGDCDEDSIQGGTNSLVIIGISKTIIHRDLAARNILISEDHTCKVADFGFARDVIASHVYERKSEGRLPIRWMAPESLYDNIFSVKSDVWSFGVLIWEVVTLGSTPYPGLSAADVMRKVRDGYRLDKPDHCRRELYNIMYYCWDKDPKQRPSFTECVGLLEKLIMTETDYIELERFPDHSYYNMMSLSGEKL